MEDAPRTYTNPVGAGVRMGDPFVARFGETYYLTGTTDAGAGFRHWTSPDLVTWREGGFLYRRDDRSWGRGSFWAPELFTRDGRYYLVYSSSGPARAGAKPEFRVCLAVADEPAGPYRDLHAPWCDPGRACIDGHVFQDTDGRAYLYYARVGVQEHPVHKLVARGYGVALAPDLSGPDGDHVPCTQVDRAWEMPPEGRSHCTEGLFVFREGARYYVTYSVNHYAEPFYGVGYATAGHPLGPWRKPDDNRLLLRDEALRVSGPGHSCVVRSPDGRERFIVYHAHADPDAPGGARTVNIDRLDVEPDGTLRVRGPTRQPQPLPSGA